MWFKIFIMRNLIQKKPVESLLLLALLCWAIWGLEIYYHGEEGLIWLTYFHFAVPIGVILFLIWANLLIELEPKKRIYLNVLGIVLIAGLFYGIVYSLIHIFASGPSAMFLLGVCR